jgi:hypothetical protein
MEARSADSRVWDLSVGCGFWLWSVIWSYVHTCGRVVPLRHRRVPRVSRGMTPQRVEVTSYILHLTLTRPWQDHSLIKFHVKIQYTGMSRQHAFNIASLRCFKIVVHVDLKHLVINNIVNKHNVNKSKVYCNPVSTILLRRVYVKLMLFIADV